MKALGSALVFLAGIILVDLGIAFGIPAVIAATPEWLLRLVVGGTIVMFAGYIIGVIYYHGEPH